MPNSFKSFSPVGTFNIALTALAALLLLSACNQEQQVQRQSSPDQREQQALLRQGQELFNKRCTSCHGPRGNGLGTRNGPSLQRLKFTYGDSTPEIYTSIRTGRSKGMPAFADIFTAQQLDALTAYVLYLKK